MTTDQPSEATNDIDQEGVTASDGGGEGGDERGYGSQVPPVGEVAERAPRGAHVAYAPGSVRGGVGGGRGVSGARCGASGEDGVRRARRSVPGAVSSRAASHAAAPVSGLAGVTRRGSRGVLRAGPPSGRAEPVGLHGHAFAGGDDCRSRVRALGVPLRADVLELGVGEPLLYRDVRGALGGLAGGLVAPRRGARRTSHGQPVGGHPRADEEPRQGADTAVSRAARALRSSRLEEHARSSARERGRGVLAPGVQERAGPASSPARQSRFSTPWSRTGNWSRRW